ncbi:a6492f16-b65d-4ac0-9ebf-a128801492dc [Sclerotinia trifoliorum]|uniref:A6492f16-b65d-4ac0-9ebf-a128801492dc n=1 Tax=Sclerotinia trifoliorum TaxID=28548 RepID=A0A8H2VXC7_9HELO|nr:a6492f16-b65d-4ac0-9ebf-a128801492dc [Sclerotinia trifoliorum]
MQLKFVKGWKLDTFDSLCIIQDDEEDWAKESATMADVYGCCLLNIAASSARDSSQGCFFKRKDLPRCHVSLKIDNDTNVEYDLMSGARHPLYDTDLCPLESRGWTFQERLLSPRTVHFARNEVIWECRIKLVSETSPFNSREAFLVLKDLVSIRNWTNIVSQYSNRRLTYEKDRLIALAGIVQAVWSQTKDGYCAGIWYDNLGELCWWNYERPEKVFPKRVPTWSWAFIKTPCYPKDSYEIGSIKVSKVLKLERPRSDNPFSDMTNAVLWLSCPPLLVAKVSEPDRVTMRNGSAITSVAFTSYPSDMVDAETCVFILRLMNRGELILRRTENSQGEYERIGAWDHSRYLSETTTLLKQVFNDRTNHAGESAYVPRERHEFDDEQHVITLV